MCSLDTVAVTLNENPDPSAKMRALPQALADLTQSVGDGPLLV